MITIFSVRIFNHLNHLGGGDLLKLLKTQKPSFKQNNSNLNSTLFKQNKNTLFKQNTFSKQIKDRLSLMFWFVAEDKFYTCKMAGIRYLNTLSDEAL